MRTALLIAADNRPEDAAEAAAGLRPMPDYLALARRVGAEIIDRGVARTSLPAALHAAVRRAGPDVAQALAAFRHRDRFDRFACDSERIGIPLAALLRAARAPQPVYFIGHRMTSRWKQVAWRHSGARHQVRGIFCYAGAQAEFLQGRMRVPADRLRRIAFHADHRFYAAHGEAREPMVLSVGQEHRDYATLAEAARALTCPVRILARSPWSRSHAKGPGAAAPAHVEFLPRVPYPELRDLYERAAVVAVPVEACDFQAGITSLLEAMAMARPVVATANPGLRELFADGEAGLWVPPGDAQAMTSALAYLLAHPRRAAEMGRQGRALVEQGMTLDHWVERIAGALEGDT